MVGVDMSYLCVATGQNLSVFVLLINCTSERTSTADVCVTLICFYFCFFVDPKSQCFKRHALNYLQEIGNGWFGKVRKSEI